MLDTCLCFPREMELGNCLYLPILTMVVLQASQIEQIIVMLFVTAQKYVKVESLCSELCSLTLRLNLQSL